jgi:Tripartite tricarboxylate transporter TctB family
MTINTKDAAAGLLFIALGLAFGLNAYFTLDLGTNLRMGPGYFPLLLSGVLVVLGITILVRSFAQQDEDWGTAAWRGMFFILLGPVAFGLTLQGLGLVPALAIIAFISSFASQRVSPLLAIALTIGLTFFCVAVFSWGLGSPIRLFGPWMQVFGLGT